MTASHQVTEASGQYLTDAVGQVVPVGYKQTEVGVIPEDWLVKTIGQLCSYQNGTAQESLFNPHGGYKVISIGNYSEEGKYIQSESYISKALKVGVGKFVLNAGDLAMILNDKTSVGTIIGRVILIDADDSYVMNQRTMRLASKGEVNSGYLHKLINSSFIHKKIVGLAKPGTQIYVNTDDVLTLELPYPPIEKEQTAIANALSDIDALINELEKLITKKQAIKTATMQQLLTGRTRLPQFALREDGTKKGYKLSELGEIPEDWLVKTIGQLCSYQNGTAQESLFNPHGGYKVISIGNYSEEGKYIPSESYLSTTLKTVVGKFVLNAGDLAMILNDKTSIGTIIGRVILIDADDSYVMNQRTMRLASKGEVKPSYLHKLINAKFIHKKIVGLAKPGTQIYVNTDDILTLDLPYPPIEEEQIAIATILSDMDADIQTLQQRLSKTRQIKQGMMQELLTGRIRLVS